MISVLLADDNKYALQHFAHLVDWEALGFSLAGTAVDGNEAWEVFQEIRPQVVITDVQMPGLDGKELAKLIKKAAPETIVIFLSSYDVFDYARAAVDLSVYEYILKHELDRETLTDRLAQIRSQLEEKDARKHRLIRGYLAASFGMPFEDPAQAAFEDQYLADKAREAGALSKVIIEVGYLNDEEIATVTRICCECGADYVKTATGSAGLPDVHDVEVIRENLSGNTKMKLSGVPRQFVLSACLRMIEMGVELIGTRSSCKIVDEYAKYLEEQGK